MKKIKSELVSKKNDIISLLWILVFILSWGGIGTFCLIKFISMTDFSSFKDFLYSFKTSFGALTFALLLFSIPIYLIYYKIKEWIIPTKYIAILKQSKLETIDNRELLKLEFEMEFNKSKKISTQFEDVQNCYVAKNSTLNTGEKYFVHFNADNKINYILNYNKNEKCVKRDNPTLNMNFVFVYILIFVGIAPLYFIINLIYDIFTNNVNDINTPLIAIAFFGFLMFYISKVKQKFVSYDDKESNKKFFSTKQKNLKQEKILKPSNKNINYLRFKRNFIELFICLALIFLVLFILVINNNISFMYIINFVLFAVAWFSLIILLAFLVIFLPKSDSKTIKKYKIKINKQSNIDTINKCLIFKIYKKYFIIDENQNLLFKIKPYGYLINSFIIGDLNNKLVGRIKPKSLIGDEMVISLVDEKPFYSLRKIIPTFEYEIVGKDYKVICNEKMSEYYITDLSNNKLATIISPKLNNSSWSVVGNLQIEFLNDIKNKKDIIFIALSISIGNLELFNEGEQALGKVENNTISKRS